MNIRPVKFKNLTSGEIDAWSAIQREEPLFASPFFRPEFTQAVADVRNDVEVAVLECDGQPVGFFPYERKRWNRGKPIGTLMSDYHGVIVRQNVAFDPVELVRSCGLSSWRFDHLLRAQSPFAGFVLRHANSPVIDISQGFEKYEASRKSRFRTEQRRKLRKLEHEIGPVRLEENVRDDVILSKLIDWKTKQFERTRAFNVLGLEWVRALLDRLREFGSSDFSPMLCGLYAGDKLVAANYQLRSGNVLHAWMSAYDRDFCSYAPGSHVGMYALRAAASAGFTCVDFGKGREEYKGLLQTGAIELVEGAVDLKPFRASVRSAWWAARRRIGSSPLRNVMMHPLRKLNQFQQWLGI